MFLLSAKTDFEGATRNVKVDKKGNEKVVFLRVCDHIPLSLYAAWGGVVKNELNKEIPVAEWAKYVLYSEPEEFWFVNESDKMLEYFLTCLRRKGLKYKLNYNFSQRQMYFFVTA